MSDAATLTAPAAAALPPAPPLSSALRLSKPGEPRMEWIVGVDPDGQPVTDSWLGILPHLVIGGRSGSGKSCLTHSLLCQIMHNNSPAGLQLWIAEPRNELQAEHSNAHVARFIDASSAASPRAALAALLSEAVTEVSARLQAMNSHPARPGTLTAGRRLAAVEPDTAGHLNYPYMLIIIEECATYFCRPLPTDRDAHAEMMELLGVLLSDGSDAGVHLCCITQYPTKENLPVALRAASRRICLATPDGGTSKVLLDEPVAATLQEPGTGFLHNEAGNGGGLIPFRALHAPPADIIQAVASLPQGGPADKLPAGLTGS